jgi:predicted transcriptional regulator
MPRTVADIHFEIDAYLHRRLRDIARDQDRTLSAVMRQAALQYVNTHLNMTRSVSLEEITDAARKTIRNKP